MIPDAWTFVLLAAAAFRVWKLLGDDAVLDRPRERALAWIDERTGRGTTADYLLTCPWCAGFWIALVWWMAWGAWPHGATVVAVPFALSAAVGYLGVVIDRLEG